MRCDYTISRIKKDDEKQRIRVRFYEGDYEEKDVLQNDMTTEREVVYVREKVIGIKGFSFPLNMSDADIRTELNKELEVYISHEPIDVQK